MASESSMNPADCGTQSRAGMKANWRAWLASYAALAVVITVVVVLSAPKVGWPRSILAGNMLGAAILGVVASAWYGYPKYTGERAKKSVTTFVAMMFAGGLGGAIIASVDIGKPIAQVNPAAFAPTTATPTRSTRETGGNTPERRRWPSALSKFQCASARS